jgi:hypothetical protein
MLIRMRAWNDGRSWITGVDCQGPRAPKLGSDCEVGIKGSVSGESGVVGEGGVVGERVKGVEKFDGDKWGECVSYNSSRLSMPNSLHWERPRVCTAASPPPVRESENASISISAAVIREITFRVTSRFATSSPAFIFFAQENVMEMQ